MAPLRGSAEREPIEWHWWERLLSERGIVIDRPQGSAHPRFPDMVYPLAYGYIPGTVGGDGAEVDIFVGSGDTGLAAALITYDPGKDDVELKLQWNATPAEEELAHAFLERHRMRVELIHR